MSYLLGIDVGTTRTAAAIGRAGARPSEIEIVNLGDRASAVPSVLYIGDDGSLVVGEAAERRAVTDPDHVVREFKRRIGDPTPVVVAGRPWAPEELSARLVRWVVDRVAQREGASAARIAVTHPASWGPHKKERLGGALAGQGLPVSFLAEPQAAALHYASGERLEPGSTIAVYDLGGGTFDAAVVHKDGNGFGLLGRPEGLERLGGIDFDEVVFEHVRQGLPEAFEGLDESDPAVLSAVAAVRRECAEAKEALSSDTEVSIPVLMPGARGSVRLHRSEFEAMIRPQVEETVEALRRAVTSAGLAPDQLSAVLLVGGSSRIPLVGQLVSEQLGRPVAVDADPKNAIAMGAVLSLAPPVGSGTGAAPPQVPAPRPGPPGRHPMGTGAVPPLGAAAAIGSQRPGTGAFSGPAGGGGPAAQAGPPTQRVSATGSLPAHMPAPMPPPRPPAHPARPPLDPQDGAAYEYAEEWSGRRPAQLVSLGGAAAAVALVAAVFLWPSGSPISTVTGVQRPDVPASVAPGTSAPTSEPTAVRTTDDGRPAPPPVGPRPTARPPATTAPPATTEPPPTTTPPTTTEAPPVTTEPPPVTPSPPPPPVTVSPGSGPGPGPVTPA
jgi:actin-like ATPase involved in cell morphogenesis